MSEILLWVQAHGQVIATLVFGILLIVNQVRLLYRTRKLARNIDEITGQVRAYLAVVMETGVEEGESGSRNGIRGAEGRRDEEDGRLVAAVLQEIFP